MRREETSPSNAASPPLLSNREVHVWYSFADEIADPDLLGQYHALMSADERARHDRFLFAKDRHLHLLTRALVRTTLSRYAGVPPTDWRFAANPHGKPAIASPAEHAAIRFNLSHCRGLVACAVTREWDVGVDVEDIDRPGERDSTASRFFAATETAALLALPAPERAAAFFDYWTLKEAYLKARGQGLSTGLDHFTIHRGAPPRISFAMGLEDDPSWWQLALFQPSQRHRLALAVRRPPDRELEIIVRRIWPLTPSPETPAPPG